MTDHIHRWRIEPLTPGGNGYVNGVCGCGAERRHDGRAVQDRDNPRGVSHQISLRGSNPTRRRRGAA